MMFKFETSVKIGVIIFVMSLSSLVHAAQNTNSGSCMPPLDAASIEVIYPTPALKEKYREDLSSCARGGSTSDGGCATAPADFKKAQNDAADACSETSIGDCEEAFSKCSPSKMKAAAKSSSSDFNFHDPNAPHDINATEKELKACPAMASKDVEKFERDLEKEQTKVKDLETKVPQLNDELVAITRKTAEKIDNIKADMAKATTDHATELTNLKKQQNAQEAEITKNIFVAQDKIQKEQDNYRQIDVSKTEAKAKYEEAKTQIELNCHASASAQVGKMQTTVLSQLDNNAFNRGGFGNMLKNIGLTDREAWNRVADKYYNWCIRSTPTERSKESANRAYQLALAQAAKSQDSIKQAIALDQAQMDTLRNNQPCLAAPVQQANGTSGGETETCKGARQAVQDLQNSANAYNTRQDTLTEQGKTVTLSGQQEWDSKNRAVTTAKQNLADEKTRLANLTDFLAAKYAAGGSSSSDAKSLSKAFTKFNAEKRQAAVLIECTAKNSTAGEGADTCTADPCKTALTFLQHTDADIPDTKKPTGMPTTNDADTSVGRGPRPTTPSTPAPPTRVPPPTDT